MDNQLERGSKLALFAIAVLLAVPASALMLNIVSPSDTPCNFYFERDITTETDDGNGTLVNITSQVCDIPYNFTQVLGVNKRYEVAVKNGAAQNFTYWVTDSAQGVRISQPNQNTLFAVDGAFVRPQRWRTQGGGSWTDIAIIQTNLSYELKNKTI